MLSYLLDNKDSMSIVLFLKSINSLKREECKLAKDESQIISILTNSYSNVVSSFFSSKFQRSIEEMLVAPVPTLFILLGYILGGVSRGLLTGIIVTIVAFQFVDINIHSLPIFIDIKDMYLNTDLFQFIYAIAKIRSILVFLKNLQYPFY